MTLASNSYTNSTWVIFWGSGSLLESKWCHYVMVEAHRHLKRLPASMLDICKVFEHIDILFWGMQQQPQTVIPTLLVSDFGVLDHLWSQNDVIMSWLRLTANSDCFPASAFLHILSVWAHWYAVNGHMVVASNSYTHPTWLILCGSGSLVESKWCDYVIVEADSQLELLPKSKLYI